MVTRIETPKKAIHQSLKHVEKGSDVVWKEKGLERLNGVFICCKLLNLLSLMHALKGGWVRQIYALAKSNESAGKNPRIRLSKEKRKALVESFIKKYQKSNNGKFPSISLTHKEVGGSFYIIREIVREIIHKNRVLGPAKLTKEEQSIDRFLEQNPLGSISTTPLTHSPIHSNESPLVTNHQEDASDASGSDEVSIGSEYKNVDSEQIINGNLVDVSNGTAGAATVGLQVIKPLGSDISDKELIATTSQVTDAIANVELQVIEPLKSDISDKELAATSSEVTQTTADIVVETFALQPVAKQTDSSDGKCNEVMELIENLDQAENAEVTIRAEDHISKIDDMNSTDVSMLKDEKVEDVIPIEDKKVVENISDSVVENSDCSVGKSALHKSQNGAALEVVSDNEVLASKTNEQSQAIVGEAVNASNVIHPKVHGTLSGSHGESTTQEVVESKDDAQHVNSQKGGNKTLDRINLESWEGTSKSNTGSKSNPLWGKFRSFVAAFAKFWSE